MKNTFQQIPRWASILVMAPLLTACYDDNASTPAGATKSNAQPIVVAAPAVPTNAVAAAATNAAASAPVAVPAPAPAPIKPDPAVKPFDVSTLNLSPGLADVIKLVQSGVSADVVVDFVNKTPHAYVLSADEVVYLNDLGVPQNVVSAMLRKQVKEPIAAAAPVPAPALEAPTNAAPAPLPPPVPAPTPAAVTNLPWQPAPENPQPAAPPAPAAATTVVTQPVYVTQPATTVVSYQYFYDSLAPYGSWEYVADYGYCWRPTVAIMVPGWRPYCHSGRWMYTDSGWYWHSDYTWGWAPFHYGRWHMHGHLGWVWVPDTCWGPSWVTWRYSSGHYGWAPLPPGAHYAAGVGFSFHGKHVDVGFGFGLGYEHFTFVAGNRFCDRDLHRYAVPAHEARTVYNNTTIINNYVTGNNNTIVNTGIARDQVARRIGAEVPSATVRDLPADRANVRPDRISTEGGSQVVYRPALQKSPGTKASAPAGPAPAPAIAPLTREAKATPNPSPAGTPRSSVPAATTPITSGRRTDIVPSSGQTVPARTVAPTTPNRSTAPTPTTTRQAEPARTYTPPASSTPAKTTSPTRTEGPATRTQPATPTRSYTPPASTTPSTAPSRSYIPATRSAPEYYTPANDNRSSTPAKSEPATPTRSYTPPASSPSSPAPTRSYTPPSRTESTPAAPARSYAPAIRSESAPSPPARSYSPQVRSESPSYSAPARVETRSSPSVSNPTMAPSSGMKSGGGNFSRGENAGGNENRRMR